MGDVVRLPRDAAQLAPRAYEDPRWAERHAPDPARTAPCGYVFAELGLPDAEALFAEIDARIAASDCGCTAGHVCRRNGNCPRITVPGVALFTIVEC